jgi:alkyldihydroxyacetonephosphate synthase
MPDTPTAIAALRRTFGTQISTEAADLAAHAEDWWPLLKKDAEDVRVGRRPLAVVRPSIPADVARLLQYAGRHGVKVVPFGAGSGVTGACVPAGPAISLDMQGMASIVSFEPENLRVTVESGIKGGALEAWLNAQGWTLGHYPQSLHLSTVGGWVSTTASGTLSSKYGGIENLVLGLEVVLASGETVAFRPVPRAAIGPRLMQLFIGAEGTLGVVTKVTLKAFPLAEERRFIALAPASLESGIATIRSFYTHHLSPALIRLYDETEAAPLYAAKGAASGRPLLLLCSEGARAVVDAELATLQQLAVSAGATVEDPAVAKHWEAGRYNAEWYEAGNAGANKIADSIEVSASWSELAPLYRDVMAAISPFCRRAMGHVSHCYTSGASIYFICFLENEDPAMLRTSYARVWNAVMERTLEHGGSISHHHGIGLVRAGHLPAELGSAHGLLRKVKGALDPEGTLNPGKLGIG